jgi:hypothetical protein
MNENIVATKVKAPAFFGGLFYQYDLLNDIYSFSANGKPSHTS